MDIETDATLQAIVHLAIEEVSLGERKHIIGHNFLVDTIRSYSPNRSMNEAIAENEIVFLVENKYLQPVSSADGYLASVYHQETQWYKLIDPEEILFKQAG